jgi:hypothetical protein
MHFSTVCHRMGIGLLLLVVCAHADQIVTQELAEWKSETKGCWRVRTDHRGLLAMRHPWETSEKGNFALIYRSIKTPATWQGPVWLHFYCSDDYHTADGKPDGTGLGGEGFIGHRFKQILVDSEVVWEKDVSDPVVKGESPRYRIKLDVEPGAAFRLSLLVFDSVASDTVLEDDFHVSAAGKPRAEDEDASRFMTTVYWGDFAVVDGDTGPQPGRLPSESKVRAVHNRRWPLPPFGDGWEEKTAEFKLDTPVTLPETGFPVRMGVPLPAGKVSDPGEVRLQTAAARGIPAQKTVAGRWPDDSLRWVLFDFTGRPAMESVMLAFEKDHAAFTKQNRLKENETAVEADCGVVRFTASAGDPLSVLTWKGEEKIARIRLNLRCGNEDIPGSAAYFRVLEEGPFRSSIALEGAFDTLRRQTGSFTLYVTAWQGLPWLQLTFRIFNDTAEPLVVSGLEMIFDLPEAPEKYRLPGGETAPPFRLQQDSDTLRLLNDEAVDAARPVRAAWGDMCITTPRFTELFPKALAASGKTLTLDLAAGGNTPVIFTPGEAKTHTVWIAGGGGDPDTLAALAEQPPILANPAYYCATGVLGPAKPHGGVPKLSEKMKAVYAGKTWRDLGLRAGIRHYPDSPYYGGLPNWSNNYYERMLNLWSEWFMSGDRFWYDLACDVCAHLLDTGIVHSQIPGRDWLGALHGPGENHVAPPWNPTLRIAGMDLYAKITGMAGAREAVLGVADYCVRSQAGIGGSSSRQQAGPFDSIITAFINTGEMSFADEGAARVESMIASMDRRRGVWQDTHGSQVYRGNIPWMVAQAARPLYWWYRLSGDVEAAQALTGLAESLISENTDWDTPGALNGYSHNPHFKMTAVYDLMIIPVIFAAYELTEDPFFRDAAIAQWRRWVNDDAFDSIFNTYMNTPWLVWYLHEYDVLESDTLDSGGAESAGTPGAQSRADPSGEERQSTEHTPAACPPKAAVE